MIQKLQWVVVSHNPDGSITSRPPNNVELMDKVNELIDVINKQQRIIDNLSGELYRIKRKEEMEKELRQIKFGTRTVL